MRTCGAPRSRLARRARSSRALPFPRGRSGAAWQTSSGEGEAHPRNRDVLGVLCEELRLEGVCDGADDHRPAGAIQKLACLLVRGDDRRLPARCRWRGRKDLEPLIMAKGGEGQSMHVYACAWLLAFLLSRLTASNGITPAISSEAADKTFHACFPTTSINSVTSPRELRHPRKDVEHW